MTMTMVQMKFLGLNIICCYYLDNVTINGACSEYDMFILGSRRLPTLHLLHHPVLLGLFMVILDLYQKLWLINQK